MLLPPLCGCGFTHRDKYMKRFEVSSGNSGLRNILISAGVLAIVLICFWLGINRTSADTLAREQKTLEEAVHRSIAHCYAVEGEYPESLDYIKEHYGLTYDEDSFFVDYQPVAANVMPDVTIIAKGGSDAK